MTTKINGTNTAASPAITGADTDTGLSFGTDTVNINTGGTTKATIDSSGNLVVTGDIGLDGQTSPTSPIHIRNKSTDGYELKLSGNALSLNRDGAAYINQLGTGDLVFRMTSSNTERMRLLSSGKILANRNTEFLMGTDAVDYQFEQITNDGYTLGIHANNTNQRGIGIYYTSGKTADPFFLSRVGNSLKTIIRGDGDLENANNSYGSISDVSMKENIVDANSQWNDIKNIKVRNYNFKESTGQQTHTQIGVIAQELETVSPKLVRESEDGIKTVSYSLLYMKAVKALQEAQARIETLESEKTQMQTDLTALTARVTALEAG